MTMVQRILHPDPGPYLKPCPICGVIIPASIKGCWSCGEILDPHLIKLAKGVKP